MCLLPVHRRGLGPTNPSAGSHLSVAQIDLQHLLNTIHLSRQILDAAGLEILEESQHERLS